MNKYQEIIKKESGPENVSFVSSGEDRRTTMEISRRWIVLILCLLLVSTIVGCVGLMIGRIAFIVYYISMKSNLNSGFTRIERQEMKNFEEILKAVSKAEHDGINKEFTGNDTVEDLAEYPKVCC